MSILFIVSSATGSPQFISSCVLCQQWWMLFPPWHACKQRSFVQSGPVLCPKEAVERFPSGLAYGRFLSAFWNSRILTSCYHELLFIAPFSSNTDSACWTAHTHTPREHADVNVDRVLYSSCSLWLNLNWRVVDCSLFSSFIIKLLFGSGGALLGAWCVKEREKTMCVFVRVPVCVCVCVPVCGFVSHPDSFLESNVQSFPSPLPPLLPSPRLSSSPLVSPCHSSSSPLVAVIQPAIIWLILYLGVS